MISRGRRGGTFQDFGQPVHILARTGSQTEVVKSHPTLNEMLTGVGWITWLNADRCPTADAVEQPGAIENDLHAELSQELTVERTSDLKAADSQHDMNHAIDLDAHGVLEPLSISGQGYSIMLADRGRPTFW